jgi:hypothetical protein
MKPKLKPPGTKRLILRYNVLLSTSAFKFSLRRYNAENVHAVIVTSGCDRGPIAFCGRGSHSSTFQLNLSRI